MIKGFVFYKGKSRIDAKPIVGIATLKSKNGKTGNMVQTWIIREDIPPVDAIHSGEDESICGKCPLRGFLEKKEDGSTTNRQRSCYVNVANSVYQIYKSYKNGGYVDLTNDKKKIHQYILGRKVRLGAYGDPTAIPLYAWKPILNSCFGHTGYTHQWRMNKFKHWNKYLMASTHSVKENEAARKNGWRTFRTAITTGDVAKDEVICPASKEMGFKRTCETCMACSGGSTGKRSIVITIHGSPSVVKPGIKTLQKLN